MKKPSGKPAIFLLMFFSSAVFLISTVGMLERQEPFYTWFYCFAWWSYILFAESSLHRHSASLLFSQWRRFLALLPLSVSLWLVFELFNFRLQNWHYVSLPQQTGLRWAGYTLAFATVLPGVFTTWKLLDHFRFFPSVRCKPLDPSRFTGPLLFLGSASILLPLLWPRYFFPLVWGAFIFLLEPLNYRAGAPSLLRDLEQGSLRTFCLLLGAGLWCGLQWEMFNYWAGSKWVYTVPFVGDLKLFEMPVLGFLGFPPFAVECFVMVNTILLLSRKVRALSGTGRQRITWCVVAAFVLLFNMLVFAGIDRLTVISFKP